METLWQDIRYGLRMLARHPGFTIIIVLVLTVAIGANTAVFSVVNAVVFRPLPYENADRIVIPWVKNKEGVELGTSIRDFIFLREQNRAFEDLAASQGCRFYVTGINKPHEAKALAVSSCLFSLLGVQPLLGRGFLLEEEQPGNDRVVVVSHAFWRDYLGGSTDVIGKTITLDGEGYTIVGVMPPKFEFPFARSAPFWMPLVLEKYNVRMIARLKKAVTLEQARAEMAVLADRLKQMDPASDVGRIVTVDRLLDRILEGNRKLLFLLLGAAGFVLLIACSNVANLFLARATVRQREMAMRVALGASRWRILRQMLTESLVLSAGAGILGLVLTFWTITGLISLCPADIPRLQEATVDFSVLLFTLGVSVLTGLLFGMVPAWRVSDVRVGEILKEGGTRSPTGRGWRRLHGAFVISQVGISLILLTGATLLIRSLTALQKVDLGFRPENVLAMHIDLPLAKYPESRHCQAFFQELLQQVRAFSGVRSASLVCPGLCWGTDGAYMHISLDGRPLAPGEQRIAKQMTVSSGFFETMGIKLLKGRTFTDRDIQQGVSNGVAIDGNMARKYFANVDPIGQRINGWPIVGVVSTVKDFEVLAPLHDTFYAPMSERLYFQNMDVLVRTSGDPMRLAGALQAQVTALDKDQTIAKIETLDMALAGMLAPRRFTMVLLGIFASMGLILATVGVYGVLQYTTTQQTHDIGLRMALGATRIHVLREVVGQGLKLVLFGIVIGLAGAWALTRVLSSLLYDVTPMDPLTLAGVSCVLTTTALLASYIPAHWAAGINPVVALRQE